MVLIEGIGDELVVAAFVILCTLLFIFAWMSTFVHDPPEIADHVTPGGVVSQNLDFPGSIEDDLERIANEIEEEAEAVENEISVLTLQRTAFLQTLTNPGESETSPDGDNDDDEVEDDDDDYETIDGDSGPSSPADNSPSGDTGESIPTFEFPCPHDDEAFAVASPSLSPPPPSSSLSAGDADDSGVILSPVSLHSSPSALSRDNSLPACTPSAIVSTALTTTSPTTTTTTTSSSSSALPASSPSSSASPGISSRPETYVRRRAARNSVNGDAAGNSSALSPPDASGAPASASSSDGHMTVRIKFINDVIREMRVKSTDTIRDFKATFFAEELAALNRVRFIFNGQMLSDHLSFGDYNITNNTVIHCLVSRAGSGSGGSGGGAEDVNGVGNGGGGGGEDVIIQELDLSRLVFPLVAVILSCVWYFRVQYRQLFNATSSAALLLLTGIFFFAVFTSLRNRAAVANNNVNNNNNNNNANAANVEVLDNTNRTNANGVSAS